MNRTIRALLAFASLIAAPCASATSYSDLIVFGDSLVDPGNAYIATGGAQASPVNGYYFGRFSNGPNFADYLSLSLTGSYTSPALQVTLGLPKGDSVAVGGADAQFKPGETSPSFLPQIGYYQSLIGPTIAADALVLVTFGGNDVRDTILTGGPIDFSGASADFLTGLEDLYALGARNFVITGSPDIGLLPISIATVGGVPGRLDELTDRSQQISALFAADGGVVDALPGASVTFFDLFAYEHALIADPAAFGLPPTLNTTTPCQIVGGGFPQIANCANSLYFDAIHPTTQVHAAIAAAILAQLPPAVPEPAAWAVMLLGAATVGAALRRAPRRRGAASG